MLSGDYDLTGQILKPINKEQQGITIQSLIKGQKTLPNRKLTFHLLKLIILLVQINSKSVQDTVHGMFFVARSKKVLFWLFW